MDNHSSNSLLPGVEIAPQGSHKATIVWLHGLGDSGDGFAPIAPELKLDPSLGVKFIFPHAPQRAVTINNGMKMRAWYDIKSMDMNKRADLEGVMESSAQVKQIIEHEISNGIPSHKILLIGFSQGGVIAYHLGTRLEMPLAGIVALSTYMCEPQNLAVEKQQANQKTPILCCHGTQDPVIPIDKGRMAYTELQDNGYEAEFKEYDMPHSVCVTEIQDIATFITQQLTT